MEQFDTLFVINQELGPDQLALSCRERGLASALVLSSHQLFPDERRLFAELWQGRAEFVTFADLLDEADLVRCDEEARSELLARRQGGEGDYAGRFMAASLAGKNRLAYQRLCRSKSFSEVLYTPGLGICPSFWRDLGKPLHSGGVGGPNHAAPGPARLFGPLLDRAHAVLSRLRPRRRLVPVIAEGGTSYLFFSPLKRLRIRGEAAVQQRSLPLSSAPSAAAVPQGTVPCMTVHGYDEALARALGGVLVFVDGYHPANYPPAYIDGYGPGDSFVPRTMFDARWFTGHGKRICAPPLFLEREFFADCAAGAADRVLIAFNHAGDWTSLISRCDTDRLVAAVVELARALPELSFRMRLHPTMDHPAHEGVQASRRIARFVAGEGLANLHLSDSDLASDLEWCQLCLSEYSQVLLDAWRMGKLGAAVNLTRRRSFMQDYADLGFFQATSVPETLALLRRVAADLGAAVAQQNRAVGSYNALLSGWLEESPGPYSGRSFPQRVC